MNNKAVESGYIYKIEIDDNDVKFYLCFQTKTSAMFIDIDDGSIVSPSMYDWSQVVSIYDTSNAFGYNIDCVIGNKSRLVYERPRRITKSKIEELLGFKIEIIEG